MLHLIACLDILADLHEGVTDEGVRALASSGCGKKLTSLCFEGECLFLLL